ncbi:MAG TPA: hypothetical protein VHE35_05495, partial [Kofleriaceae bacterium]|nr:hypothetical protein [Kofleriaceae bacterium]
MTPSRGLAAALLGAAALASRPAPAAADYPDHADGTIAPWKKWTRGLFFAGHGGSLAGIDEGGFGLDLELARGHGRWQFFGDSLIEWTALSVVPAPLAGASDPGAAAGTAAADATTTTPPAGTAGTDGTDGFDVRLGFGARRVLRAVEPDSSAAIEL